MTRDDSERRRTAGKAGRTPRLTEPPSLILLTDVFGLVRGSNPLNYVERLKVDHPIANALVRRMPVVIYGSSKQGKTCVRRKAIDAEPSVVLSCQRNWSLADINNAILRAAGYIHTASRTETEKREKRTSGRIDLKAKIPFVDPGIGADTSRGSAHELANTVHPDPVMLSDVNQVISQLKFLNFQKIVVLEEFHLLPIETQKDFAQALKTFFDESAVLFVIVGVWRDNNRLSQLHGDLTGRIIAVDADEWNEASLRKVIQTGGEILDITFDGGFIRQLLSNCFNSVWIVQEICYKACTDAGVVGDTSQNAGKFIGAGFDVKSAISDMLDVSSGRYINFIKDFAKPHPDLWPDSSLSRWIVALTLVSDADEMETGFSLSDIAQFIEQNDELHLVDPDGLAQVLLNVGLAQARIGISPPIIDYIHSLGRLDIVDRTFLPWRDHQVQADLLEACGLPSQFVGRWTSKSGRHRK